MTVSTAVDVRRDPGIDALRVYAMSGVVTGHWLVTGFVIGENGLRTASPLSSMPFLAPVTWVLQTLGLFFFVGGFAAERARSRAQVTSKERSGRTAKSVLVFGSAWLIALGAAGLAGASSGTLQTVAVIAASPLWFMFPYLVLRFGHRYAKWFPLALIVPGPWSIVAAWAVPWAIGTAAAKGKFGSRRDGMVLAVGGFSALLILVTVGGYPVSAVGVPGQGRSNLNPPTLAAAALAVTQIGVFLAIRSAQPRLRPWVRRLSSRALPIYLWHQSVLLIAVGFGTAQGWVPGIRGLVGTPDGAGWVLARVAWLPVLGAGLAVAVRLHGWQATRRPRIP